MESSVTGGGRKQKIVFKCATADAAPVVVVGDAPELGAWDLSAALVLISQPCSQGGFDWIGQAELSLGHTIEYKFVKMNGQNARWESGNNRRFTVIPVLHALDADFRE
ncbi:MAG TPA: carbohydrate-binding module family 20 domain-containing protein [Tepidisphaeraceae bacterium]|nr:carbohydrate-binding module family 20 domain-containing protein [Tepidisphaeraceae bacterium]